MSLRIITFCNADYIPVAQNWLKALDSIGLQDSAQIISLDDKTRDAFPQERVLHRPFSVTASTLHTLWAHRIVVLRELLDQNITVIHSDADAVWLKDPIPDITACKADMVFSQGTFWPRDVHEQRKLVLCCGFFCLHPTPSARTFLDAVAHRMPEDQDDQIAVNRIAADWLGEWQFKDPYEIPFRDTYFLASRSAIRAHGTDANGNDFSIAVLPHHAYPRLVDLISDQIVVAHPFSGKTLSAKQTSLGALGLWKL